MKNKIKVIHIPEVCKYNEFISRTVEIQQKNNIDVIIPNICIDSDIEKGTNNLSDILKYKKDSKDKIVVHFHWPEKLYKKINYETFKNDILKLKDNNIKLVKTIHNLKPHEMLEEDKKKEEFLNNNVDGIVLFSESQLKEYNRINNNVIKKCVIPHPNYKIEVELLKSKIKNKQFVLCIPGRIRKYKQVEMILEVLDKLKGYNVKIIVVGKPDDMASVEKLKKYKGNSLECNFDFVTSRKLQEYIIKSDLVLLTHKYIWTSGIAILSSNLGVTLLGTKPKIFEEYKNKKIGYFLSDNEEISSEKMTKLIKDAINDGKEKIYEKGQLLKKIIDENEDEIIGNLYKEFYKQLFN